MRRSRVRLLSGARFVVRRGPENVSSISACQEPTFPARGFRWALDPFSQVSFNGVCDKVNWVAVDAPVLAEIVATVQRLPYTWPGPPTAASARESGQGTCAAKHALLRERLHALGLDCERLMVVGPLAPSLWPDLQEASGNLMEVHECLTVATPWAGPLLVDVTWHPAAIRAGLPGTLDWNGAGDMLCAVPLVVSYAVSRDFRAQKEMVRSRLYSAYERQRRDQILTQIASRAAQFS